MRTIITIAAAVLMLAASAAPASAATTCSWWDPLCSSSTSPTTTSGTATNQTLAGTATNLLDEIDSALVQQVSPVASMGQQLFVWLAAFTVMWAAAAWLISGGPGPALIAQLIRVVLLTSMCWWFLPHGGHAEPIVSYLVAFSGHAVDLLSGGQGVAGELTQLSDSLGRLSDSISQATAHLFAQGSALEDIKIVASALPMIALLSVAQLGTYLATGLVFIAAAGGTVLLSTAGVLAPLFIPWMLVRETSFMFWGWTKFAIGGALYSVVAAALLRVGEHVISTVALGASHGASVSALLASAFGTLLVIGLICWISLQITSIAASIAGGHAQQGAGAIAAGIGTGVASGGRAGLNAAKNALTKAAAAE